MQRLIDANEILKSEHQHYDYMSDEYYVLVRDIENALTVDAVPVVRCKDCKYAHMTYDGECKSCDQWTDDDGFRITLYLDGNFYCAFGERREDE